MLTVWDCIKNECNIQESLAINEGERSSNDQEAKEDDNDDENDDGDEDLAAHSGDVPTNPEGTSDNPVQKHSKPVRASKYEEIEPSMADFLYADILPIGHPL